MKHKWSAHVLLYCVFRVRRAIGWVSHEFCVPKLMQVF